MGAWRRLAVVLGVAGLLLATLGRPCGAKADDPEDAKKQPAGAADPAANGSWPMVGGDATRSAQGVGGTPFLEARWRYPLIGAGTETQSHTTENFLKQADNLLQRRQPVIPASQPITVTVNQNGVAKPLIVYRIYSGVQARELTTGRLAWDAASQWGLENMASSSAKLSALNSWLQFYLQPTARPAIVYENSTIGTLSTDGSCVFVIDDLAVPPPPHFLNNPGIRAVKNPNAPFGKAVTEAVSCSELQALELTSGKLKWKVGGPGKDVLLGDSYFLGPPLPYQGTLYVLLETAHETPVVVTFLCPQLALVPELLPKSELRVAQLDPTTGKVLASRALFTPRDRVQFDSNRRTAAVHLAAADGVLVVPTNAGSVLGVDLKTLKLLWNAEYVDKLVLQRNPQVVPPWPRPGWAGMPMNNASWKVTAPVIHDGRVVFAAPDADQVRCVKLKDGSPVWNVRRAENDLYLGGAYGDKALIVGKRIVKALSLAKGEIAWDVEAGIPAGFGVAADNVYYLPLREAAGVGGPEVCAIDVANGRIVAHSRAREKNGVREAPSNLVFVGGDVLSQTTREIVAYPQLKTRFAEIETQLAKTPTDPLGLTGRGELRLNKGDLVGAIDDLRKALANKPAQDTAARARALFYEALTDYLQRDFDKAEPFLKDYNALGKIDTEGLTAEQKDAASAEEQRRRELFLILVAQGREQQGKLREALELYLKVAEAGGGDELMTSPREPALKMTRKVWVRQRVAEMLKNAPADKARELQEEINKKWKGVQGAKDSGPMRDFIAVVGAEAEAGREARLALATYLMKQKEFLAAEQYLEAVRNRHEDEVRSGRAVYLLAQLQTEQGLIADALHYYRILAHDYAKTQVGDGKTGKEMLDALQTDKRFMPFLDETARFGKGPIKVEEVKPPPSGFQYINPAYTFDQLGEELPFFKQYRVALQTNTHSLQITNRFVEEPPRMDQHLTATQFAQMLTIWNPQGGGQVSPKHHFLNMGHLVVLPLGHMVFGIDPVDKKVLWEKNLYGPAPGGGLPPPGIPQNGLPGITVDMRDETIEVLYADGWVQRLGKRYPLLTGGVLIVETRAGLVALDPYSGKTLWERHDPDLHGDDFGDEDYVATVVRNAAGKPVATRVLRTSDGGTVKAPDFHAAYAQHVGTVGHTLVVAEKDDNQIITLRRYHVVTGKDMWKATYPAKTLVIRTGDSDWYGVVEPDGTAHLLRVQDGKEAFTLKVDPKHLDKVESVRLLADDRYLYLACNQETDADLRPWGGVQSNLMPGTGMRSETVNGELYAFDRATGEMNWHNEVLNQQVILEHFEEMPVLIFTARYNTWTKGATRNVINVVGTKVMGKGSGKLLYDQSDTNNPQQQFHTLTVDAAKGEIELLSWNRKIRMSVRKE